MVNAQGLLGYESTVAERSMEEGKQLCCVMCSEKEKNSPFDPDLLSAGTDCVDCQARIIPALGCRACAITKNRCRVCQMPFRAQDKQ
mmetsp:Transcript_874/g.1152  ORF Transcript_874/g.1152 Transcript_874/m.1152 type:complete len:87 (-) Transcript_874:35-295(-)